MPLSREQIAVDTRVPSVSEYMTTATREYWGDGSYSIAVVAIPTQSNDMKIQTIGISITEPQVLWTGGDESSSSTLTSMLVSAVFVPMPGTADSPNLNMSIPPVSERPESTSDPKSLHKAPQNALAVVVVGCVFGFFAVLVAITVFSILRGRRHVEHKQRQKE